jgi:hypothetical protein
MANEELRLELVTEGKGLAIPKHSIDYVVGKLHVGTSDDEVQRIIGDRIGKAKVQWPAKSVKDALGYAVQSHRKNQDLYSTVMGGNLGNKKPKKEKPADEPVVETVVENDGVMQDEPRNDYYNLIKAAIEGKPVDFKDAFQTIMGPKIHDAINNTKETLKQEMYKEPEEEVIVVADEPVASKTYSILSKYVK